MNRDGWPVLAESGEAENQVQVCLYMGPRYKNQPVEALRIQLGRPGHMFMFLTVKEALALRECLNSDAVSVTLDASLAVMGGERG